MASPYGGPKNTQPGSGNTPKSGREIGTTSPGLPSGGSKAVK